MIRLAKELRDAGQRGDKLGLNADELAFYDALAANESAVQVMGDQTLAIIARELARRVRENVSIDWTIKETVRAKMRLLVKRILKQYGYPVPRADIGSRLRSRRFSKIETTRAHSHGPSAGKASTTPSRPAKFGNVTEAK